MSLSRFEVKVVPRGTKATIRVQPWDLNTTFHVSFAVLITALES